MKITDEQLDNLINHWNEARFARINGDEYLAALTELKELRAKPVAVVPSHTEILSMSTIHGTIKDLQCPACGEETIWEGFSKSFEEGAKYITSRIRPIAAEQLDEIERALEHYSKGAPVIGFDRGEIASKALETLRGIRG